MDKSDLHKTEAELFKLIAQGDTKAFARIHELYKSRLVYYTRQFTEDWEAVEDIISEAFLVLWQSRHKIRSDIHLRNFLFITVRHRMINYLEAKKRRESILEEISDELTEVENIDPKEVQAEMLYLIKEAVKVLPTEYRHIFELSYERELSPGEIAQLLQMNPSTVRTQKQRALGMIKDWIRKKTASTLLFLSIF